MSQDIKMCLESSLFLPRIKNILSDFHSFGYIWWMVILWDISASTEDQNSFLLTLVTNVGIHLFTVYLY